MNRDAILEVKHLSKSFGANAVLKDIDFVVHPGDVTSIIGSSGSGKSASLHQPSGDTDLRGCGISWRQRGG